MRSRTVSSLLATAALAVPVGAATGAQVIPVRGGEVVVPDFDPARYHDSDSCQVALNAALNELSRQLGEIPFPPPGEPGYHEWAIAIRAQMDALSAQRSVCLRLGAPGRIATRPEARRFTVVAIPVARQLAGLRAGIIRARARPARQRALGLRALRLADGLDARVNLEALRRSKSLSRSNVGATRVPTGQLKQLPGFASAVQKISDWDRDVIEFTERRASTDPQLAEQLDFVARTDFQGRPYAQLTLEQRRQVVSHPDIQKQSGSINVLLYRVRKAASAGLRVIYGGRR